MLTLTPIQFLRETITKNYKGKLEQFESLLKSPPEEVRQNRKQTKSALQKILDNISKLKLQDKEVEIDTLHLHDIDFMSGTPKGYLTRKSIDSRQALSVFIQRYINYVDGRTTLEFVSNGKCFDSGLNPDRWIQYVPD